MRIILYDLAFMILLIRACVPPLHIRYILAPNPGSFLGGEDREPYGHSAYAPKFPEFLGIWILQVCELNVLSIILLLILTLLPFSVVSGIYSRP